MSDQREGGFYYNKVSRFLYRKALTFCYPPKEATLFFKPYAVFIA